MEIGRLLTAMVTPFDANGAVDYAQAKRLALALLDSGSDGVVLAGTTGESPTLSHDEKMRLFSEGNGRKRRAIPRGGATGRGRCTAYLPLLQQAFARGALPPF